MLPLLLAFGSAQRGVAQDVGVALSAGGSTGLLAGLCNLATLESLKPDAVSKAVVGTASGGTLAALLHGNVDELHFPTAGLGVGDLSLRALNQSGDGTDGAPWFASILREIPDGITASALFEALEAGLRGRDWFPSLLADVATKAYKKKTWEPTPFVAQVAAFPARGPLPLHVDPRNGSSPLANASSALVPGEFDMATGSLLLPTVPRTWIQVSAVEAAAASSAFWAGMILADADDGRLERDAKEALLMKKDDYYLGDGGLVEPFGVVPLLRRGLKTLLVFVNCPEDLESDGALLSFLFGVDGETDFGNVWPGKELLHVFPSELYAETRAALTGPDVFAHLKNVSVRRNAYLAVDAYDVDDLLIFSNQRSATFLEALPAGVAATLDRDWPLGVAMGMSPVEANLLCAFNDWKVRAQSDAVRAALGA